MENYFFIPVNSLNFNNILSSESISPSSFYEKRGFGFKRFERINANSLSNSILAYSKILTLEAPKSDREEFPIYLAVPKSYFAKNNKEIRADNVEVIQTGASVYINWIECFFVVRNEGDRKKLIAGTKRSLEIKHADLYLKNIYLVNEYGFETTMWNESISETINDYKNSSQDQITKDQKINKVKGFVYGYVSGKLKEQPSEITEGKRYFQDFVNSYSVLMNELSVLSNDSKKSGVKVDRARIITELEYLKNLKEKVSILFGGNEQIEVDNTFKTAFGVDADQIDLLKSYKYEKTRNSIYSIVSAFIKERNNDLYAIDELMDTLIKKAESFVRYNSFSLYKSLDDMFNTYRVLISTKISRYEKEVVSTSSFDGIPFSIGKDYSILDLKFEDLNSTENNIFNIVSNELLTRLELSTTDQIAQQRLDIIQHVAEVLNTNFKKDSEELAFLRRLYKSLKTVGVGFKIGETSNMALQSLACFLSRYREMDKLQDFMEKNKFKNHGITYALWGAAYGYANLSKILLEPLDSNREVLNILSGYISEISIKMDLDENKVFRFLNSIKITESKSPTMEWKIKKENKIEEPQETYSNTTTFGEKIRNNKVLNKKQEWITVINSCYVSIENDNMGGSLFDGEYKNKEFKRLLMEEKGKGNLKGFGTAKIEEVISEFSKFKDLHE